jgi:GT2 family glycosyltransferase
MENPLVSLLVLNWNGKEILAQCLDSLLQLQYSPVEIIIVDNGSTDGSQSLLALYPSVKVINNGRNLGFAAGNNVGFSHASGAYIATLNNDIVVEKDWLSKAIPFLECDASVGIVCSRQMNFYSREVVDGSYHFITKELVFNGFGDDTRYDFSDSRYSMPGYVISANGASAIYRKKLLDDLKGFDESFFAYHEDGDLAFRAFWKGWNCVYAPDAIVYHMRSKSFGFQSEQYTYYFEKNRYAFILKNYPARAILHALPKLLYCEASILRSCLKRKVFLKAYLPARFSGLKCLPSILRKRSGIIRDPDRKKMLALFVKQKKIPLSSS